VKHDPSNGTLHHLPNEDAARKVSNWTAALLAFKIDFGDRLPNSYGRRPHDTTPRWPLAGGLAPRSSFDPSTACAPRTLGAVL
jgi:hypothetical protein